MLYSHIQEVQTDQDDHCNSNEDVREGASSKPDSCGGEKKSDLGDIVDNLEPNCANACADALMTEAIG